MGKVFLFGAIAFFFVLIGLAGAVELGVVPMPVYTFLSTFERNVPFLHSSTVPYFEKFEGNWTITLSPTEAQSEFTNCSVLSGLVHTHNGAFRGTIGPLGAVLPFEASTTEDGKLSGTFGGTTVHMGVLDGVLQNGTGSGTWKDNYGCSGGATFVKADAVIDPVQGKVVSIQGDVQLVRGSIVETVVPGTPVYTGDMFKVGDGNVLLGVGFALDPVTIPANTTYTVQ